MLSRNELDRICTATLAGGFGVARLERDALRTIENRLAPANLAEHPRAAAAMPAARRGYEQGNK